MNDPQPIATWRLGRHVGREVRVFETLDSTNSLALALADEPDRAGLAIVARSQSAGRGQYGRTWSAPAGSSVLLSVLVYPPPALRPPAILTAWAAVAVCEIVDALSSLAPRLCGGRGVGGEGGQNPSPNHQDRSGFAVPPHPDPLPPQSRGAREHGSTSIKWPNDVLVAGKKIAGILIEQRNVAGSLATVVGIGLNVRQTPADLAELPEATSLAIVSGRMLETEAVCRTLIERLDADYGRLLEGDFASLAENWQSRLGLAGKSVRAECVDRIVRGRLIELDFSGVTLQVDDDLVHLPPESIRHLRADDTT